MHFFFSFKMLSRFYGTKWICSYSSLLELSVFCCFRNFWSPGNDYSPLKMPQPSLPSAIIWHCFVNYSNSSAQRQPPRKIPVSILNRENLFESHMLPSAAENSPLKAPSLYNVIVHYTSTEAHITKVTIAWKITSEYASSWQRWNSQRMTKNVPGSRTFSSHKIVLHQRQMLKSRFLMQLLSQCAQRRTIIFVTQKCEKSKREGWVHTAQAP